MVGGEGVKELRVNDVRLWKDITMAEEYSDLLFSAKHHGSKAYVAFL